MRECFDRIEEQIARNFNCDRSNIHVGLINDQKLMIDIQGLLYVFELYYCPICGQKLNHRE
jgi:hypothetical protein